MASLQNSTSLQRPPPLNSFPQVGVQNHGRLVSCKRIGFLVRAHQSSTTTSQDGCKRRQAIALGVIAPWVPIISQTPISFAAETKKGFLPVRDQKDGYTFLYPFGWQEISIEGQDKVFKDVIEPLENISVTLIPTNKQDIRDFGPPQQIAETLIKKVLAPPSQKTKLIEATEHEVDGKMYYSFEFTAQAPNYTRHALSTIAVANGKFYTLTTGANERRWGKMKDQLHTIIDSFQLFNV